MATAICRCLRHLGHSASIVQDGDAAGFEADVLLLLTNLANYPFYCRRLKKSGPQRPRTLLWLMDPLPPESWPLEAEAAALKAARWKDRFFLFQSAGALSRPEKLLTLFRLREWAYKQCSAPGYRKACNLIKHNNGDDVDWLQVRGVMSNWREVLESYHAGWLDHYVASTNQRTRFLRSRKIPAHFVPVGAYEEMGHDLGLNRDIQVGFLGDIKYGRRASLLRDLGERLKKNGISLEQVVGDCHGEQRTEWLNRTRILVSLHNYSWNPAWIRFLLAARCGALVVSEPMNDEHPMIAGVHYVAAEVEEMPQAIQRLLANPDMIRQMASAAKLLCHQELALLRSVEKLVKLAN
jgi:Glycosyl transferases group 1